MSRGREVFSSIRSWRSQLRNTKEILSQHVTSRYHACIHRVFLPHKMQPLYTHKWYHSSTIHAPERPSGFKREERLHDTTSREGKRQTVIPTGCQRDGVMTSECFEALFNAGETKRFAIINDTTISKWWRLPVAWAAFAWAHEDKCLWIAGSWAQYFV